MKHHIGMIVACILPLVLIFILPALGLTSNGLFALLLFGCFFLHLFMMRGHSQDRWAPPFPASTTRARKPVIAAESIEMHDGAATSKL